MAHRAIKIFLLILLSLSAFIESKTTPIHSHKRETDINKERPSDGAYSPPREDNQRGKAFEQHMEGEEHHYEFDHEAILGSRDTAEEFDKLPPEESKRRLSIIANAMDVNNDGKVDREELVVWIIRSFKSLNKEDSDDRHDESDTNEDGYVTWEEYVEENYGISDPDDDIGNRLDTSNEERKMLDEDKELFWASDLNADGKLSRTEFQSFSNPEEYNFTSDILVRRMMIERDRNGDGFINLHEYYGDDANNKDNEWMVTEKDKFDNDYDLNHDGLLAPEEVLRWLSPDDRDSAEQEADHLIESADDDGNGILTIKEITEHHDIFVGSEATDYGKQLEDLYKPKEEL